MRRLLLPLVVVSLLAGLPAAAQAGVNHIGATEPTWTRPAVATNNAWWFSWSNAGQLANFKLCYTIYEYDNPFSSAYNRSHNQGCTGVLSGTSGTQRLYVTLTPGRKYMACATDWYSVGSIYGPHETDCNTTILDTAAPTASLSLNAGAARTTGAVTAVLGYEETLSPPWLTADFKGGNYVCMTTAASCVPSVYNAGCSVFDFPSDNASGGRYRNRFTCSTTAAQDGQFTVCARLADRAALDNPDAKDQLARATANNANLSSTVCDSILVDRTPPTTTITGGPSGTVTASAASFTFTSNEPGRFECSLDGGAYTACASPRSYTGLLPGGHTFAVRAVDQAGNVDGTPATRAWTIEGPDGTAPETTITGGPQGTVTATDATLAFTSSEPGATFECSPDGGAFAPCTSPATMSGLSAGAHSFAVRARDAAGNTDASPAVRAWTVAIPAGGGDGGSGGSGSVGGGSGSTGGGLGTGGSSGGPVVGAGPLQVRVPRRLGLRASRRTLRVAVSAATPGRVRLALRRGRRAVARSSLRVRPGRTARPRLRLGSGVRPGVHRLEIRLVPDGGGTPVRRTHRITVRR